MFENEFYISNLIAAHLRGEITLQEQLELNAWLEASADNRKFYETLSNDEQFRTDLTQFRTADRNAIWEKTNAKIEAEQTKDVPVKKLYPYLVRIAVAAAIFIVIGAGFYFYTNELHPKNNVYVNDVKPGNNKAILTLANGRQIFLNDASNGSLAKQAGIVITKTAEGQLVYTMENVASSSNAQSQKEAMAYNTIVTPKGGQYQVILPDGTKIWLNSASSLKFPTTFSNSTSRSVQLKGEAYFEVAKILQRVTVAGREAKQRMPFIVTTQNQTVEVLGTHFNINSYADEPTTRTTLLEGSVAVSSFRTAGVPVHLKPGDQSNLINGVLNVTDANIEEALAWKNGYFSFNDENIQSIMRKLSRWYNVEVQYSGEMSREGFYAKISRSNNISQVLNALQSTKAIHFKVEGRRVTITQ